MQNTKRSKDDVLELITIRDNSKTTLELVNKIEEHVGKKIKRGDK